MFGNHDACCTGVTLQDGHSGCHVDVTRHQLDASEAGNLSVVRRRCSAAFCTIAVTADERHVVLKERPVPGIGIDVERGVRQVLDEAVRGSPGARVTAAVVSA
jgi:hypothetical protein